MNKIHISNHIYKLEFWAVIKISVWLVEQEGIVYIIDTGLSYMSNSIIKEAEKLGKISGIFLTHGHSDHVGSVEKILQTHDVPVYIHSDEIKYAEGKEPFPGRKKAEHLIKPGVLLPLPNENSIAGLTPYHTPGHSPGHVAYFHPEDNTLISGDLFTSKKGKLKKPMKMFTADMKLAIESGKIIKELEPKLVSICHGKDVENPSNQIDEYLKNHS